MYLANTTRPIAFSVNLLAKYISAPTMRYQNGIKHMSLFYSKDCSPDLIGHADVRHLNKEQDTVRTLFPDPNTNIELEIQDNYDYMTGFVNEYRIFGCNLEFITTKSQEGSQFSRGLDGIGGILRYQLDVRAFDNLSDDGEIYEDSE
ncbi:hypothetical protein FXO37_16713 [Capsicum annuum]|nr:hypothetical protein FXO37_16713 [Capsicum annuum]